MAQDLTTEEHLSLGHARFSRTAGSVSVSGRPRAIHSPSTRRVCSIRISSATLVRRIRHDTASRTRIWPSCRSSHCHSRLSVFVSPATVSWEASTSGRLRRRASKAADWLGCRHKKILFKRRSPAPMRGVEEIIFQTLLVGRIYALGRARPAEPLKPYSHARAPPLPAAMVRHHSPSTFGISAKCSVPQVTDCQLLSV